MNESILLALVAWCGGVSMLVLVLGLQRHRPSEWITGGLVSLALGIGALSLIFGAS